MVAPVVSVDYRTFVSFIEAVVVISLFIDTDEIVVVDFVIHFMSGS
jgi:hypothetical protein